MTQALVRFEPAGSATLVPVGSTILEAALAAAVPLDAPCGGIGRCRGCRVRTSGALSELDDRERATLSEQEIGEGIRLACVARAEGEVTVEIPLARRDRAAEAVAVESQTECALAVDLGTTTIAAALVDTQTGDEISRTSASNPQSTYGADVMSRIVAAEGAVDHMRQTTAVAIKGLVGGLLASASLDAPVEMAVAGNTTMLHLLAGQDVSGLGTAPYEPAFLDGRDVSPEQLGLPDVSSVTLLPALSAFVGADIVAGVLATRLAEHDGTVLLIDIGTNGEIVLKTANGDLYATSAAAGPAFEGASIECGMRAAHGAIERVRVEGDDLAWSVIGGGDPAGLCGSGVIDLTAALLEAGVLAGDGLLRDDLPTPMGARLVEMDGVKAVRLTGSVWFSQRDVRQVQLAKGAVAAAVALLLEEAGVSPGDIDRVLVAGEFGSSLLPRALVGIGLLPLEWETSTRLVGNAALAGVARWLSDPAAREIAQTVRSSTRIVDLAAHPAFEQQFVAALAFPQDS